MRMDPVLCQKILAVVESDPVAGSGKPVSLSSVEGYEAKEMALHVKYLWDEGFIKGIECTHLTSPYPEILVTDITPAGRKYLDANELAPPRRKIGF